MSDNAPPEVGTSRKCDLPSCPGRHGQVHEIETGPELHAECARYVLNGTPEEYVHDSEWLRAKVEYLPPNDSAVWFAATNADEGAKQ